MNLLLIEAYVNWKYMLFHIRSLNSFREFLEQKNIMHDLVHMGTI